LGQVRTLARTHAGRSGRPTSSGDWRNVADANLVLGAVATRLALSRRGAQRALATHGETFAAARQRVRLELAEQHLANGMQVKSVALTVGFKSPSHFVVWYRRAQGTTPKNRGQGHT